MSGIDHARLIGPVRDIAVRAGAAILEIYGSEFEVRRKEDASPVSEADERAEALILEELARLAPEIPVVAEEQVAAGKIPVVGSGPFFLVDPLDGTREFISRRGEFTVNIALIEDEMPRLGVVLAPALDVVYWTGANGGAWRQMGSASPTAIACRLRPEDGIVAIASRSHRDERTDAYLAELPVGELVSAGSSLKFCRVAEGAADVYPRFGRTMEWDTAAGQAVLEAAGGRVVTETGEPLRYGKAGFENPYFIAEGHGAG